MNKQPFILDFDKNPHAVFEPNHDQEPFYFHPRLLYAFVPEKEINAFLDQHLHRTLGKLTMNFSLCVKHPWEHQQLLNYLSG